jgi:hypothetical protein
MSSTAKLPKTLQVLVDKGINLKSFSDADLLKLNDKERKDIHNAMSYALEKLETSDKLIAYKGLKNDEDRRKAQVRIKAIRPYEGPHP